MADTTVKVLLTKWNVDATNWATAFRDIQGKLQTADEQTKARYRTDLEGLRQNQTLERETVRQRLENERLTITSIKQRLDVLKTTTAESFKEGQERAKLAAQLRNELKLAEQKLLVTQAQTSELAKQSRLGGILGTLTRGAAAPLRPTVVPQAGGGAGMLGILSGFTGGGFMGLLSGVMGGTILGQMAFSWVSQLKRGISELGDEAGREAQLFETLTRAMGGNEEKANAFVAGLQQATRGLVDDGELTKLAALAMRSSMKLSSDQVIDLTNKVTALAMSIKGPQGASQAVHALVSTFIMPQRVMALARAAGLDVSTALRSVRAPRGSSAEAATRMRFEAVMALVSKKFAELGPLIDTVSMAMDREKVARHNLQVEMVKLIETSPTLIALWDTMASTIQSAAEYLRTHSDEVKKYIDDLGRVLLTFASAVAGIISLLAPLVAEFVSWIPRVSAEIDALRAGFSRSETETATTQLGAVESALKAPTAEGKATAGRRYFSAVGGPRAPGAGAPNAQVITALQAEQASLKGRILSSGVLTAELEKQSKISLETAGSLEKMGLAAHEFLLGISAKFASATGRERVTRRTPGGAPEEAPATLSPQQREMLAGLESKIEQAGFAAMQAAEAAAYKESLRLEQERYKHGEESAEAYYANLRNLREAEKANELTTLKSQYDDQVKLIESRNMTRVLKDKQIEVLTIQTAAKELAIRTKYKEQEAADDEKADAAREARQLKALDRVKRENDRRLQMRVQMAGVQEAAGEISPEQRAAVERDVDAQLIVLEQRYLQDRIALHTMTQEQIADLEEQTQNKIQAIRDKTTLAEIKNQQAITQAALQAQQERVAIAQARVEQVTAGRGVFGIRHPGPVATAAAMEPALQALLQQQVVQQQMLIQQLNKMAAAGGVGATESPKYLAVSKALDQMNKTIDETTNKLVNLQTPLSEFASSVGTALNALFPKTGGQLGGIFDVISKGLEGGGPGMGTATDIADMWGSDMSTSDKLSESVAQMATAFKGISGMTNVIGNPNLSVGQAIMGGASAGAEIGSLGGPWGTVIGAAVGGVVGAISGIFQKAARHIAETVENGIKAVMKSFQEGSATLAQTISGLEEQRASLVAQETGRKGGQKYLDQMLPGLDQQISQLIQQQKQIISNFETTAATVNLLNPALQSVGSQIDSIIEQWKQYIDAGGNVTTANRWLEQSFANLRQTTMSGLNKDYEDAIQNALDYNGLLIQRADLIKQEATQERDILTQGVLVRHRTEAQTKAQQIADLRRQRDLQLEQLNQQISLAQYKMTTEQTIFNLTGTRVDLESRLLQLKFKEIDLDNQRIVATQQLLAQFQAMGAGYTVSNAFLQALAAALFPNSAGVNLGNLPGAPPAPSQPRTTIQTSMNDYTQRRSRYGEYQTGYGYY